MWVDLWQSLWTKPPCFAQAIQTVAQVMPLQLNQLDRSLATQLVHAMARECLHKGKHRDLRFNEATPADVNKVYIGLGCVLPLLNLLLSSSACADALSQMA